MGKRVSRINCSFFIPRVHAIFPSIAIKPMSSLKNDRAILWRIQRFLGNTVFSRGFWGKIPKLHNRELWRIIFSYKHVWMAWVGVIYYGKWNYYELMNCIRHWFGEDFIQNYFKIFHFSIIWDKKLGSHTELTGSKTCLDASMQSGNNGTDHCLQIHKFELHLLKLRQKLNIYCNCFRTFTSTSKTRETVQATLW